MAVTLSNLTQVFPTLTNSCCNRMASYVRFFRTLIAPLYEPASVEVSCVLVRLLRGDHRANSARCFSELLGVRVFS